MRGPVLALISRPVIAIGVAITLTATTDWGISGVFVGSVLGMIAYTVIVTLAVYTGEWRQSVFQGL